jgi:hypothetical protein
VGIAKCATYGTTGRPKPTHFEPSRPIAAVYGAIWDSAVMQIESGVL